LIGTVPEDENGKWNLIKSSSDVNSGNSGGPLLDEKGQVIGIVVSRKDNISYSLPISEMLKADSTKGKIHNKKHYSFALLTGKKDIVNYDYEVNIPKKYDQIIKEISANYKDFYTKNMDKFFLKYKSNTFPELEYSLEALYGSVSSTFPEVVYKDTDSNNWYISKLKTEKTALENNGRIKYKNVIDNIFFIEMIKPDNVKLKDIFENPKLSMDLLLKGINIPRKIANDNTRILSFGEPIISSKHVDVYNRNWDLNVFLLEFSDGAIITFSTPTPQGKIFILKAVDSNQLDYWLYDMKKIMDFVYLSYFGKLKEWNEFLSLNENLPDCLKNIKFNYKKNESVFLDAKRFSLNLDNKFIEFSDDSTMFLNYDFYLDKGKVVWDIRKVSFSEDKKDNFLVLYKNIKPDTRLPDSYLKNWTSYNNKNHPYNENSYSEEGRTNIGTILVNDSVQDLSKTDIIYTLYYAKEGNIENNKLKEELKLLKNEIKILE